MEAAVDLDPVSASPAVIGGYQHTVSGVDELLSRHLRVLPSAPPTLDVVPNRIQAERRSLLGRVDHDLRIEDRVRLRTVADTVDFVEAKARRTISTFSCDIAYSDSPAASSAFLQSK